VVLTEKGKTERRTQTDENGKFCFEVKTGAYTVTPIITSEEKEKGLKLIPAESSITVEGKPVLDLKFQQTELSLSGSVLCLKGEEKLCSEIEVQLLSRG